MSSFDSELETLVNEWLKRGDHAASMLDAMRAEMERLELIAATDKRLEGMERRP